MEIREAIEALKNNNKLCCDDCEGECGSYKNGKCYCAEATVVSALEEYIAIGTVEECREARERQRANKPINIRLLKTSGVHCGVCPICKNPVYADLKNQNHRDYCGHCGQSIDWSDTD